MYNPRILRTCSPEIPSSEQLTKKELSELNDGTSIRVRFFGGNGGVYTIKQTVYGTELFIGSTFVTILELSITDTACLI